MPILRMAAKGLSKSYSDQGFLPLAISIKVQPKLQISDFLPSLV